MERVDCILQDPVFLEYLEKNEAAEQTRIFCHHDLPHFLDVCRIAMILNLERGLNLEKEIIYAAGLLHDIGRWMEYENGTDHALASAQLAEAILRRCGFPEDQTDQILGAIQAHRSRDHATALSKILYEADKASRMCHTCPARSQCKHFLHGEIFRMKY